MAIEFLLGHHRLLFDVDTDGTRHWFSARSFTLLLWLLDDVLTIASATCAEVRGLCRPQGEVVAADAQCALTLFCRQSTPAAPEKRSTVHAPLRQIRQPHKHVKLLLACATQFGVYLALQRGVRG